MGTGAAVAAVTLVWAISCFVADEACVLVLQLKMH